MPSVERAFVFADLSGYTALTEAHGDERAAAVASRFAALARAAMGEDGEVVKTIGDAVMLALPDGVAALRAVTTLSSHVGVEAEFPCIRVGIHVGPAVLEAGDYFGSAVNLAARIAAHAKIRQVLCSEAVVSSARDIVGVSFRSLGEVLFKNVSSPVTVFEALLPIAERSSAVDPVCRMRVDGPTDAIRVEHDGHTYFFCSADCADRFRAAPAMYS